MNIKFNKNFLIWEKLKKLKSGKMNINFENMLFKI